MFRQDNWNSGIIWDMQPIFVRPITEKERQALEAGLRCKDAFVLRRCQILLASARGERAPAIAHVVGCDDETVRLLIRAFNATGLAVLQCGSRRPHHTQAAFSAESAERLRELLHRSLAILASPPACGRWRSPRK